MNGKFLMSSEIRILVVEDSKEKKERVVELLSARLSEFSPSFDVASDYNLAVDKLKTESFDLVILDLLIPIKNRPPTVENAQSLVEMMFAGDVLPPAHIIGLTEFSEAAEKVSSFFSDKLLALELFDWTDDDWADKISEKIAYVVRSKYASVNFHNSHFSTDLLILTARYENEYRPIVDGIIWDTEPIQKSIHFPSYHFSSGRMRIDDALILRTAVLCIGEMGTAAAACVTAQALNIYRPRTVAMLGMCCGFNIKESAKPIGLGDVLIAREVGSWETGKYDENTGGYHNRADTRGIEGHFRTLVSNAVESSKDLLLPECASYLKRASTKSLRKKFDMAAIPKFHLGLVVSGSSIVADKNIISEIVRRQPNALGLDMELYGVYKAVEKCLGKKPLVIGIKGVADFGTGTKHDGIQPYASVLSLLTLIAILKKLYADFTNLRPVS